MRPISAGGGLVGLADLVANLLVGIVTPRTLQKRRKLPKRGGVTEDVVILRRRSVTLRRAKFASAMLNQESGSALLKVESCTDAPKTAATSR